MAIAMALAVALLLQGAAIHRQSLTGDEAYHLIAGHQALRYGANLLNWEHPPLVKLVAALPSVAVLQPLAPPLSVEQALAAVEVVHQEPELLWRLTVHGRWLMFVSFAIPLLGVCYALGRRYGGPRAGWLLLLLMGLAFPVVPLLSLMLTDAPLALAFGLTALAGMRWSERPSSGRAAALGLAFGFGLVTKFSAVLLVATVIAALLSTPTASRPMARRLLDLVLVAVCALLVLLSVYGLANLRYDRDSGEATVEAYVEGRGTLLVEDRLSPWAGRLQRVHQVSPAVGQFLVGAVGVQAQNAIGVYHNYAFGEVSSSGRWWYFPIVLALKTPLALLLTVVAIAVAARPSMRGLQRSSWVILVAVPVYLVASMTSTYNIGYRHLLPIAPLLLLPVANALARRPRAATVVVAVLAIESIVLAPLWMSATNTWWLGDANPTRFSLSHGDLEYKQNFRRLAQEAQELGVSELRVLYPGVGSDVVGAWIPSATSVQPNDSIVPGWYAVSVLVEQFVPGVVERGDPAKIFAYEGLLALLSGYEVLWHEVRKGEDHGWIAGTFRLYHVPVSRHTDADASDS